MQTFLALVAKDFRIFFKDKLYVSLTFFVPMVLIVIFGMIFGGSGSSGPTGIRLMVIDEAQSDASTKLIDILKEEETFRVFTSITLADDQKRPLTREDARDKLLNDAGTWRYALVLPEDLIADEDFGLNLELLYNPQNQTENQIVQGILQKALFSNGFTILTESQSDIFDEASINAFNEELATIIASNFGGDPEEILSDLQGNSFMGFPSGDSGEPAAEAGSGMEDAFSGMFNIRKEQLFGKGKNPAAQSVAGWAVMFLLFSMTGAASALFEERENGLFQRLLAGPAARSQILWSKFAYCALLGLLQMAVLIAFGHLLFGIIDSLAQIVPLLVISSATAAAATAFGMLLSALAKTPGQANGLGTFLILSMSALGGAMFPIFMLPPFIRDTVALLTLPYWAMDGLLGVLWRDASLLQILPQTLVLIAIAGGVLSIALWRFQRGNLFR